MARLRGGASCLGSSAPSVGPSFGGGECVGRTDLEQERRLLSRSFPGPGSVGTSLGHCSPQAHTWGHSQVARWPAIPGQVGGPGPGENHRRSWVSRGSRKLPRTAHPVWPGPAFREQLEQKQRGGGDPHLLSTELGGECVQEPVSSYIVNSCRKFRVRLGRGPAEPAAGARPATHHDGVDDIALVVPEGPHGLGPGHVGLCHHQLDVTKLQPRLVHLQGRGQQEVLGLPQPQPGARASHPWVRTSSSSSWVSSHSSLARGPGVDSGTRVQGSAGTLNFSAAALCACWERSSICTGVAVSPAGWPTARPTPPQPANLGLPEDHVGVRGWALEDVRLGDDKEDVLGLLDGNPGDTVDLPQAQLGHGLGGGRLRPLCCPARFPAE